MKRIEKIVKSKMICDATESYYIDLPTKQIRPFFFSENCTGVDQEGWKIKTYCHSHDREYVSKILKNFLDSEVMLLYRAYETEFDIIISSPFTDLYDFDDRPYLVLPTTYRWEPIFDRYDILNSSEDCNAIKEYFKLFKELKDGLYFIVKINELPDNIFKILSAFNPLFYRGHLFDNKAAQFNRIPLF